MASNEQTEKQPADLSEADSGAVVCQQKITLTGPWSFIDQVADACDLTAAQISEATEKGAVWWQKQDTKKQLRNPVRLGSFENTVKAGDVVLVNYNSAILAANIAPPVLVSDQVNYSIWDKPRGMLSQGTKWSNHCSITYCVEKIHNKRAFLVHRLDRAAGGLIVIAHTRNALTRLAEMFAKRQIEKTYQATVSGKYDGKIPLVIETPVDGKSAHTELIDAVAKDGNASPQTRLTVKIKTGRKHQIRSHLAGIGHPVVGDRLFDKNTEHQHDLQLDAVGLKFTCPFADRAINVVLPHV